MNSLQRRLQLSLALALVVLFGILWAVGNQSIRGLTEDFIAARLEHDAEALLAALVLGRPHPRMRRNRVNPVYSQPFSGHYYSVLLDDGVVLNSRSSWDRPLEVEPLQPGGHRRLRVAGPAGQQLLLMVWGYRKQGSDITLAVAEDLTPLQERRNAFKRHFALLALAGLLGLLAIQRILVRWAFRSLQPVRQDIDRVAQGKQQQLSETVPAEVLPLVRALNHMLQVLSGRLERSRNALGNLAHALKGPLNLLLQYFDDRKQADQGLQRVQARMQVLRIRQLMDRELKRARLAGKGVSGQRFDARRELPDLIGALQQVHAARSLQIEYQVDDGVPLFADREDMLELLGNLLDNACKWARSRVSCQLQQERGLVVLIEDDGAGVSKRQLARLSARGVRLDEMVEGHGLGLAIARDIVNLYGGEIRFGVSAALGGLQVRVDLPETVKKPI